MIAMASLAWLFAQPFFSGADQRKHQSATLLAFVRSLSGDRWIPLTKGQQHGNVSIWWLFLSNMNGMENAESVSM